MLVSHGSRTKRISSYFSPPVLCRWFTVWGLNGVVQTAFSPLAPAPNRPGPTARGVVHILHVKLAAILSYSSNTWKPTASSCPCPCPCACPASGLRPEFGYLGVGSVHWTASGWARARTRPRVRSCGDDTNTKGIDLCHTTRPTAQNTQKPLLDLCSGVTKARLGPIVIP